MSVIESAKLVSPVDPKFGVPYTDHPRREQGFSFECLPHGLLMTRGGHAAVEPWHRVLRLHMADEAVPPVGNPVPKKGARGKAG